ncbi:EVE domain-containing protein [Corallococcus sp. AB011P]|uniref:EVE domain-containing protein n=1 Tax=Corallococcus sp. AB011P TaxID=2316735 RepID=UPI000EA2589B|nr:EVE domain-containing protein [Corallococcus sp. AB011P]RKG48488.1 EVE domain-containing protein [Corallococcus sp. AB011P]
MKPRKVDLAFEWMSAQPRRPHHYRDEIWPALAKLHPDEFAESKSRKTPWYSLHRDMSEDERFVRGEAGLFELATSDATTAAPEDGPVLAHETPPASARVWIVQANPKFYRILEVLQRVDRMQFLANRYKDRIAVGDIVLLWMSGEYAGIYAQARVVEGVAERTSGGEDAAFWADGSDGNTARPRVVLAIDRRFLGNALLRSTIAAQTGLEGLMILRQPNGTNFAVSDEEWSHLRALLPSDENVEPSTKVLAWAKKRAPRAGKLYEESCGELLERFVAEAFADGEEHSRDEITQWLFESYPLFKPITVQCHIEKYTTNFRSRVHYGATADHDLLFRVAEDWFRLRLFRPGEDPAPIHELPGNGKSPKVAAGKAARKQSPVDRNRRLLYHLATYGELTDRDLEDLGLGDAALSDWLDALLVRRPGAYVATPLFFQLVEGDATPAFFTTRLAARFMGEHLRRHASDAIPELEEHVWSRFGSWHLTQPNAGDIKTHAYLSVPLLEARDVAASERIDLFAQLSSKVIGDLIREPDFLSEQQSWSADAADKTAEGPLSRQLRRSWRRPLLLSAAEVPLGDDGHVLVGEMDRSEVTTRSHVISGQPLLASDEWEPGLTLGRDEAADRLLRHPLATAIVQFEVHRLFAGLSGEPAALLTTEGTDVSLELDAISRGPLWQHLRVLLEQVGYWPVGATTRDSSWESAVGAAVRNLEQLVVLERHGATLRLNESYQSLIKAHPGHPQNRGEKPYRVRLAQFLSTIHGGKE